MKFLASTLILIFLSSHLYADANNEPDINEVQKTALDYARIRPDELSDMKRKARMQALLPRFQAGVKRSLQNDIDISVSDNVSVNSSGVNIGPETSDINQSSDSDTAIEVKAVWYLNELIFNRDVLDISEEARYQIRERRQILAEANRLYFERQRLLEGPQDSHARLRLEEVTADLDALTGGWFSRAIGREIQ